MENGGRSADGALENPANVFVDTNILLNYAHQGIEQSKSSLVDDDIVEVVIGVTVAEELADIQERRSDIYTDFVDFVLAEDGNIEEYDPSSRHQYFQNNDERHVKDIQMKLSQLDDRATIQQQLRYVTRMIKRRLEHLLDEVIPASLFDQQPGLTLLFALQKVIPNKNDGSVVGDAALWASEGLDSSAIFVTMDKGDLLNYEDQINETLRDKKDDCWTLTFAHPRDVELSSETQAQTSSKSVE